jgi:hypothetical protein
MRGTMAMVAGASARAVLMREQLLRYDGAEY